MKKTLVLLALLLVPTTIVASSKSTATQKTAASSVIQPDNLVIPGQRMGAIRLGMGMDEVEAAIGKPTYPDRPSPGVGVTWYYKPLNLTVSFTADPAPTVTYITTGAWAHKKNITSEKLVWKDLEPIKVLFQTSNGISIGSTSFDVKRAFSSYTYNNYGTLMSFNSLGVSFNITTDYRVSSIAVFRPR